MSTIIQLCVAFQFWKPGEVLRHRDLEVLCPPGKGSISPASYKTSSSDQDEENSVDSLRPVTIICFSCSPSSLRQWLTIPEAH